jgi:hypothetical protein
MVQSNPEEVVERLQEAEEYSPSREEGGISRFLMRDNDSKKKSTTSLAPSVLGITLCRRGRQALPSSNGERTA